MSDLALLYTRALYDNFHPLYANWEPSKPVELGDYGLLQGRLFIYIGNVKDRGLKFDTRTGTRKDQKIFSSKGTTQIKFNAKGAGGQAGASARATLEVTFSSEDAVFFNAAECSYSMIRDKDALGQRVMQQYRAGKWDKRWAVITDLVEGGATTLAVSGSQSASIVFEAGARVNAIDLADASVGLSVKTATNVGYQVVAAQGLTPLFGLSKIQRPFPWISSGFEPAAAVRTDPDLRDALVSARQPAAEEETLFFGQAP
jgi:hypothetical protein